MCMGQGEGRESQSPCKGSLPLLSPSRAEHLPLLGATPLWTALSEGLCFLWVVLRPANQKGLLGRQMG